MVINYELGVSERKHPWSMFKSALDLLGKPEEDQKKTSMDGKSHEIIPGVIHTHYCSKVIHVILCVTRRNSSS
jgi:hypothetical protein